jgi:hypothetical protein
MLRTFAGALIALAFNLAVFGQEFFVYVHFTPPPFFQHYSIIMLIYNPFGGGGQTESLIYDYIHIFNKPAKVGK